MSKKTLGFLCLICFVLLCLSVTLNLFQVIGSVLLSDTGSSSVGPAKFAESIVDRGSSSDKIALIDVEGMISNFQGRLGGSMASAGTIKKMLKAAVKDPKVKGILIRINSPGGEVTASDVIFHAVESAAKSKPVLAYMDTVGASGGYYVACGAHEIMANETTLTGSIGVIIQALKYKGLMEKAGLESVVFTSGDFKDMLSPSRDMRPEERVYVQGMVDEMYEKFLGIVSKSRGLSKEELREGIADGRIFSGKQALEKKLINQTGYLEDAFGRIRKLAKSPKARIVRYQQEIGFGDLIGILGKASTDSKKVEITLPEHLVPQVSPGRLYFLPPHYVP